MKDKMMMKKMPKKMPMKSAMEKAMDMSKEPTIKMGMSKNMPMKKRGMY